MASWQYKVIEVIRQGGLASDLRIEVGRPMAPSCIETILSAYGVVGWELVNAVSMADRGQILKLFFKAPA